MIETCTSLSCGISVNTEETQKRERVGLVCQQHQVQIAYKPPTFKNIKLRQVATLRGRTGHQPTNVLFTNSTYVGVCYSDVRAYVKAGAHDCVALLPLFVMTLNKKQKSCNFRRPTRLRQRNYERKGQ